MSTVIRIREDVKEKLNLLKIYPKESYNDVIIRIIDDYEPDHLTDEDINDIEKSLADLKSKRYKTIEQYAADENISLN